MKLLKGLEVYKNRDVFTRALNALPFPVRVALLRDMPVGGKKLINLSCEISCEMTKETDELFRFQEVSEEYFRRAVLENEVDRIFLPWPDRPSREPVH